MIPIAILYATPEDAANEIAYLYKRKYPISWIEMGEEADGQRVLPEDYATLYIQFANAIHKLVPKAPLGGPAFEGTPGDVDSWADANGRVSFLGRFVDYLKARGHLRDFTFFSFEHYPCMGGRQVRRVEFALLGAGLCESRGAGLEGQRPAAECAVLHDGGQRSRRGQPRHRQKWPLAGRLRRFHADCRRGRHLLLSLHRIGWQSDGGGGFLPIDENNHVRYYPPQYLATQVITKEWVQPVDAMHKLFRVASDVRDADGNTLVTAYAVERPDGNYGPSC